MLASSGSVPSSQAAVIATYWTTGYSAGCAYIAATTLCIYDYLLTLDQERRCIWGRKLSVASILFLINRYANICDNGFTMVQLISWPGQNTRLADETCALLFKLGAVASALIYVSLAVFAAVRTCAIWNQNKKIFYFVLCTGLIYPALALFIHLKMVDYSAPYPARGCINSITMPSARDPSARIIITLYRLRNAITIALELFILVLTCIKTTPDLKQIRQANLGFVKSISFVIWYNGTLQFGVFLILNVASFLQYNWPLLKPIVLISDSLTSVLLSRFILNLREAYVSKTRTDEDRTLHISDISNVHFAAPQPPTVERRSRYTGDSERRENEV